MIATVDLLCAECGTFLGAVNPPRPPVPTHCFKCSRARANAPVLRGSANRSQDQ